MTVSTSRYTPPTYGNWREPRSAGIGRLNFASTIVAFIGVFIAVIAMMVANFLAGVVVFAVTAAALGLVALRNGDGLTVAQRSTARVAFRRSKSAGANLYRSGPLGRTEWGQHRLPGLLAKSVLTEHQDAFGRPFAMITYPHSNHYVIVLVSEPPGLSGLDPTHVDNTVANFGGFLGSLGLEPDVAAAAVTIETSPDSGVRFHREVNARMSPTAPPFAQQMLKETLAQGGSGASVVRSWVTITFKKDGGPGRRQRDAAAMGRELAARVPHFVRQLADTGAGGVRPATAQDLCEMVRVAYDPAASRPIEEGLATGQRIPISWNECGPAGAEAAWDAYTHDSGTSVTWSMTAAPRGAVYSSVLSSLLRPTPGVARKRVTMLYAPLSVAAAAKVVEGDLRNARNLAAGNRPTARADIELTAAQQTAREEAQGAGLVDFGMLVTATIEHGVDLRLDELRTSITNSSAPARVRLRPCYGSQDSAFAAALPLGLVLPSFVSTPKSIQEVTR